MATRSKSLQVGEGAVEAFAVAIGTPLAPERAQALSHWLAELARWNHTHDLTAARSTEELLDLMLADALVLARLVPEGATLVDVGTGAGAPGLALALARPDLVVTLVEPLAKRTSFLRVVTGALGRTDITIVSAKGDAVKQTFDVALARATLAPAAWLELAATLLRPGGAAYVFLAREEAPTHPILRRIETTTYTWPRTLAERHLVRYERG